MNFSSAACLSCTQTQQTYTKEHNKRFAMHAAKQEREIQTGNWPVAHRAKNTNPPKQTQCGHQTTQIKHKHHAQYEYTTVKAAARSAERHGAQVSRNENGHAYTKCNPKNRPRPNTAAPTQLPVSYTMHLYTAAHAHRSRYAQASADTGESHSCKSSMQSHNTRQHIHVAPQCTIM
jgi:hypothetical protein